MSALFPDTSREAEEVLIGLLRKTPTWRKAEMVGHLNLTVRQATMTALKHRHPEASPQELRRRLADIVVGRELAERAYGQLDEEGTPIGA